MAEDQMRIRAVVVDQASAHLQKIHNEIAKVKSHPGLKGVTDDLAKLKAAAQSASGALSMGGGLGATMAMGLGAGIGAGVAAAIASIDQLAKKTLELRHQSRSIGMQPDDIRALEAVGKRFQIPMDQMAGGLQKFSDTFDEFRRRRGTLYGELYKKQPELSEQLLNEQDVKKALGLYLSFLSKIQDPHAQRQWADAAGLAGWERLFVEGADKFKKEWADVVANMTRTTPDLVKSAREWEDALNRLDQRLDNLQRRAGTPILGWVVTGIDSVIATMNQRSQEIDWFLEKMGKVRDALGYAPDKDLGKADLIKRKEQELRDVETTIRGRESGPGATRADEERRRRDELTDELKKLREELQRQREGQVQKSALEDMGGGIGSMIHRASLGGGGGGGTVALGMRGRYQFAPRVGSDGSAGREFLPDGEPAPSGPVSRESRRRQRELERGLGIPRRDGNPFPTVGEGAGIGPYKDVLDHIAKAEGTAGRGDYNASLGYGRFLPGRKEMNLTGMTLNEISRLGYHMRRQPGNPNSSALGRYQIVGQTMRSLMRRMGLKGDELFDEQMQDRMAAELARDTRGQPGRLANEWASLRGERLARAAELMRQIPRGASTAGGVRLSQVGYPSDWTGGPRERLQPGQLTDAARAAGVGGSGPVKVDTSGTVNIDLNLNGGGFADGYKARATMDGIVGGVKFNRGQAMPTPSSTN